jgi:hypothetical protein
MVNRDMTGIEIARNLLNQLQLKTLSLEEFLLECTTWALDYLSEYHWRPMPTKPQKVIEYEKIKAGRKKEIYFLDNRYIIEGYFDESNKTKNVNFNNYMWLCHLKDILPQEDIQKKINEVKQTYHLHHSSSVY